jgi:hypothetical protein
MTTAATPTVQSVTDWKWIESSEHRGRVPELPRAERYAFSAIMNIERPTREQIKLRDAIRRKIDYRIARQIDL